MNKSIAQATLEPVIEKILDMKKDPATGGGTLALVKCSESTCDLQQH